MKSFFVMVGSRIKELVSKLISVKILILAGATYLMAIDRLDPWVWFAVALSVISIRTFEKKFGTPSDLNSHRSVTGG